MAHAPDHDQESRVDAAYRHLIDYIERADLPEGARLPSESQFVDRLGLSRPIIREALARLRAEGRAVSRRGSGTFMTQKGPSEVVRLSAIDSVKDLIEWHEFRLALESETAALCAERRTDEQLAAIIDAQNQLIWKLDGEYGEHEDAVFHRLIAVGSHNDKLIDGVGALTSHIFRWNRFARERGILTLSERRELIVLEHGDIIDAITARKADQARTAARRHLLNGRARTLSAIEELSNKGLRTTKREEKMKPLRKTAVGRRAVLKGILASGVALPFFNKTALGQAHSGTIRVWTFLSAHGQSPREKVLKTLIDAFQARNPKVSVVVESQPFQELETKFVAAAAQQRAPDLIWIRDTFLSLVADRNALADLDTALSADFRQTALPDMFDAFLSKSVFDGRRLSLPLWPTPAQIIFYRKDALRDLGLDAPPLKWGAFVDAAAKLTKDNRFGLGLPTNDNSVSAFINIMSGFGPEIFDPKTGRLDLTGAQAVEVGELVRRMSHSRAISPTLLNAMGDDIQDQFAAGRFAMAQAFAPRFAQYQRIAAAYDPKELAVSAWPSFGDRPPAVLLGPYWTVGLAASSKNKEAAAAFLESLYAPDASLLWAQRAGLIPDRKSVLSDPWFSRPEAATTDDFFKLLQGPGAFVFPQRVPDITKIFTVLNNTLQELIGTEERVQSVLARAKSTLGW